MEVRIADGGIMHSGELPAVAAMATIVRSGPGYASHAAFGAIGGWMEPNGYAVDGPCREVFLEPVTGPQALADALVEIQFPVRRAA
jgi:effector-binding domain-containing protein